MLGKVLIVCLLLSVFPAQAKTLQYAVYAGGFPVVDLQGDITQTSKTYTMVMAAKLRGWLYRLAPWSGTFSTNGSTPYTPKQHVLKNFWQGEAEEKTLNFNVSGFINGTHKRPDGSLEKLTPAAELAKGAQDVLTPLWTVMQQVGKTQKCAGSYKVFDGRRSFMMNFKDLGQVKLAASKYNIYQGETSACTVEIKPLLGKWYEKPRGWLSVQEQSKLQGSLPTLYFAKLPNTDWPVVVRAVIKTRYGTAVLHLTGVTD